eukprot:CAMPEP_0182861796 /NCGR_PEP_ID=MMETSP0034_2-20130328/5696_1 /TAXON_ID=156128 /ORGANISM="Nephroselmis pyriformis, Strain CCMP717" /LENGTH=200 /DNA_ID=CAMNT_0024993763 /DNA_START=187 /DNA_END=785 /DNA_ORIENTATION=+
MRHGERHTREQRQCHREDCPRVVHEDHAHRCQPDHDIRPRVPTDVEGSCPPAPRGGAKLAAGRPKHRRKWRVDLPHRPRHPVAQRRRKRVVKTQNGHGAQKRGQERPRIPIEGPDEAQQDEAEVVRPVIVQVAFEARLPLGPRLGRRKPREELGQGARGRRPLDLAEGADELIGCDVPPLHREAEGADELIGCDVPPLHR